MTKSWLGEPTAARGGHAKRPYAVTPKGEEALRMSREIREHLWTSVGVASS